MAKKNPTNVDPFGELIKQARIDKGLTQAELGAACGVSQAAAGAWESGSGKPTVKNLHILARVLDVSVELLRAKLLESNGSKLRGAMVVKSIEAASEIQDQMLMSTEKYLNGLLRSIGADPAIIDEIIDYADQAIPNARVRRTEDSPMGVEWGIAIQTDDYAINIVTSWNRKTLIEAIFHLASHRAFKQDKRNYFIIAVDNEDERTTQSGLKVNIHERVFRAFEYETSLLGVALERVKDIKEAKQAIDNIEQWQQHLKNNNT